MRPLSTALLYGIVDLGYVAAGEACAAAERMCEGGVDVIQLRAKNSSEEAVEALGSELIRVTEPAGVPLIINDHPHLVPSIGAQGAHVGQDDLSVSDARWRAGRALAAEVPLPVIGKSTHSYDQVLAAAAEGADYIGFGPLFPTPTKAGRPAIGLEDIRRVRDRLTVPVFCIGGIKRENLDDVIAAGARRVVIVSGILQSTDMAAYCRDVKARLKEAH